MGPNLTLPTPDCGTQPAVLSNARLQAVDDERSGGGVRAAALTGFTPLVMESGQELSRRKPGLSLQAGRYLKDAVRGGADPGPLFN